MGWFPLPSQRGWKGGFGLEGPASAYLGLNSLDGSRLQESPGLVQSLVLMLLEKLVYSVRVVIEAVFPEPLAGDMVILSHPIGVHQFCGGVDVLGIQGKRILGGLDTVEEIPEAFAAFVKFIGVLVEKAGGFNIFCQLVDLMSNQATVLPEDLLGIPQIQPPGPTQNLESGFQVVFSKLLIEGFKLISPLLAEFIQLILHLFGDDSPGGNSTGLFFDDRHILVFPKT